MVVAEQRKIHLAVRSRRNLNSFHFKGVPRSSAFQAILCLTLQTTKCYVIMRILCEEVPFSWPCLESFPLKSGICMSTRCQATSVYEHCYTSFFVWPRFYRLPIGRRTNECPELRHLCRCNEFTIWIKLLTIQLKPSAADEPLRRERQLTPGCFLVPVTED